MPHGQGADGEFQLVRALLVGPNVGRRNHPQRDAVLTTRFGIQITACHEASSADELPTDVDVMVLEHSDSNDKVFAMVPSIKQTLPDMVIILINGGLTQMQKGWAFYQGVADYFPLPANLNNWELLAARIVNLTRTLPTNTKRR
jgi:DNA-binding NtrC family response regulator